MAKRKGRNMKISKGERRFLAVVLSLGIVVAVVFVSFFISDVVRKHALQNNGVRVLGTVDAKDIQYVHAKTGTFTRRTIEYHFQTLESEEWVARENVPVTNDEYETLAEGKSIELRYDAHDPSINVPVSALKHISPTYSFILVLAGILGGLILYSSIMKKYGKRYLDTKSKNRWVSFLKFLVQMAAIVIALCAGGFLAGILVRGLNLLLFAA